MCFKDKQGLSHRRLKWGKTKTKKTGSVLLFDSLISSEGIGAPSEHPPHTSAYPEPCTRSLLPVLCRDHSRILVGDSRGRVFSWSVSDQPGRSAADHWVKDEGGDSCSGCSVRFSLTERRHHCRNCGQLFCQK